jgi:hypothetical protein
MHLPGASVVPDFHVGLSRLDRVDGCDVGYEGAYVRAAADRTDRVRARPGAARVPCDMPIARVLG